MNFKIPFSGRAHKYTEKEKQVVLKAMDDADPLTQGKYLKEFEKKFCEYIGSKYAYAMCNATAALEIAAQLCQFEDGDEVICPSHTFTATVYPFIKKGARPVWADIDRKTRVVTADTIKKCITSRTKAIIVVHLYGFCVDMQPVMDLAREHNLLVIEDTAQALGTERNGQKAGTFGDFGIFSFHSHKNITTLGEGGMLVVKDQKYADLIPLLRHNGHCAFNFERKYYWQPAMGNVDLPELNGKYLMPGNYCLGEVECALGIELLSRIDEINARKRERAIYFIDELKDYPLLQFHRVDDRKHNYHLLVAEVANNKRDEFIRKMAFEKGIQCIVQYYPLNRYDFYKKLGFGESNCPAADAFFDNMVSFPFHHSLSDDDFEYMLKATKDVIEDIIV